MVLDRKVEYRKVEKMIEDIAVEVNKDISR